MAMRARGGSFGGCAVIDTKPRSASLVAYVPCLLFKWPVARFSEILDQHAEVAFAVMRLLTSKLREDVASHVSLLKVRAVHDAMRSYVPGSINEQLVSGDKLAPVLPPVSVLFVAIIGNTSYALGRRPG